MFTQTPPTHEADGVRLWELGQTDDSSVAYVEVDPGAQIKPHYHEVTYESYIFVAGEGVLFTSYFPDRVRKGMSKDIAPNVIHRLETTEGIAFYVVTTPPYNPDDHFPVSPQ